MRTIIQRLFVVSDVEEAQVANGVWIQCGGYGDHEAYW